MLTPGDISPDKVAIYIRWSTDDQGEGTTLVTQLERCKHFMLSQGWTFNADLIYVDDGYSGGTLDRPAMTHLRQDVDRRLVECVVAYKIDRLSRSVIDLVELVLREWEGRCFVRSTTEDVNTLTPAGKMFFYMLVSFAEYERNVIRERTMSGKVKRAEQGLNPGYRPPYGYVKGDTPGKMAVVEHEASVVRRIFDLYLSGNGTYQIANTLNADGTRRRGELWNRLMIRRLLTNPIYVGILEYGKSMRTSKDQQDRHGLKKSIRFDKPRYAAVANAITPVVDRKTWDEVNQLLQARSDKHKESPSKPSYGDYLLSGLATCRCGAQMNGKSAGGGYHYYYCSSRKRRGASVCDAGHINLVEVDVEIERLIGRLLSAEGCALLLPSVDRDLQERQREAEHALAQVQARRKIIGERYERLGRDYRSGDLSAKLYAKESAALEQEQVELDNQSHSLRIALNDFERARSKCQAHLSTVDMISSWSAQTAPERRQLLQKLTKSVTLHRPVHTSEPPTLEIEWIRLI